MQAPHLLFLSLLRSLPSGDILSLNLPAPHCPLASSWLYCPASPTSTQSQILANALCSLNSLLPDLHTHRAYTQFDLCPTVGFLSSHATQYCQSPLQNERTQQGHYYVKLCTVTCFLPLLSNSHFHSCEHPDVTSPAASLDPRTPISPWSHSLSADDLI